MRVGVRRKHVYNLEHSDFSTPFYSQIYVKRPTYTHIYYLNRHKYTWTCIEENLAWVMESEPGSETSH